MITTDKASRAIFSYNLTFLMKKKGVLPTKLASDLKISDARVDSWIAQTCYPKYELMVVLCNYLDYFDIYKMITVKIDSEAE